jgi:hypothetical protein
MWITSSAINAGFEFMPTAKHSMLLANFRVVSMLRFCDQVSSPASLSL